MRGIRSYELALALAAAIGCSAQVPSAEGEDEVASAVQALEQHSPIVRLEDGVVRGARRDGSRVFIGIPYAAPPVGERRWKPPAAVSPWQGMLDATGPGRTCVQLVTAAPKEPSETGAEPAANGGAPQASEDCLQVNVFAPEHAPDKPVPVMVWLHGGSNATGSANAQIAPGVLDYDGVRLRNAAPRDVVVVSVNYRLGPLGFLAHPALSKESHKHISGNYGLLDQQAALRWVQNNIAAFGGDPKNVTLFGESAGAFDTCYQAVLKGSAGLFHRMIMESGSCTQRVKTLEEGEADGAAFAEQLGCKGNDESALECLRSKAADKVQRLDIPEYPGAGYFTNPDPDYVLQWGERDGGLYVVVDGVYLKEQPIALFAAGRYAHVPAIIGTNAREAADTFTDGPRVFESEAQYREAIARTFEESAHAIQNRYAARRFTSVNDAAIELGTDFFFVCPAWQLARRLSRYSDVYVYNWSRGVNTPEYEKYGPAHSAELVWVWNLWAALGDPDVEKPLVAQTADYWTALAEDGDPNREGSPSWPKYVASEDQELNLNLEPQVERGRRDARCPLWSRVYASRYGDDWAED